mgnify:CR=1 FL=1
MRWVLRQLALNFVKMLAGFAGIFLLFSWGCSQWKEVYNKKADDPEYAAAVFEPLVPFARVLASREYHPFNDNWPNWDCTYAIVELDGEAPVLPPSRVQEPDGFLTNWRYRFGGDWQQTPEPEIHQDTRSALHFCARYFDPDVTQRLAAALANPGSWYMRDRGGEELHIYSHSQKIAARIRFGD